MPMVGLPCLLKTNPNVNQSNVRGKMQDNRLQIATHKCTVKSDVLIEHSMAASKLDLCIEKKQNYYTKKRISLVRSLLPLENVFFR